MHYGADLVKINYLKNKFQKREKIKNFFVIF